MKWDIELRRRTTTNGINIIKRVLHPNLKISMFCVLSQNYQHFLEKKACIFKKIDQKTQNGIGILGQTAFK